MTTEQDIQAFEASDVRAPHAVTCCIENVSDLGVTEDDPTYWAQVLDMAKACVEAGDFDHLLDDLASGDVVIACDVCGKALRPLGSGRTRHPVCNVFPATRRPSMADYLYVPDDDSEYGPVWDAGEAREHFTLDDLADARPAELVVSLDGYRGHYLAVDWLLQVCDLLGEVPGTDPFTQVDRMQHLDDLRAECVVAHDRYHAHHDVVGAGTDHQATYGSECPVGDDGFPDCNCQWVGELAEEVENLLGEAGYVTEWNDGVRTFLVAPEADANGKGIADEPASPDEPSPREGGPLVTGGAGGSDAWTALVDPSAVPERVPPAHRNS